MGPPSATRPQVSFRVVRADGGPEMSVPMSGDTLTCGTRADLTLPDDPFISPVQARFFFSGQRLAIEDLGGGNGVFARLPRPAINRLLAHSKLNAQPVTLEMAEREVRDLIRPQEPKRIKIEDIQRVVARQYNVSRSDLLSSRRTANVVRPRQVAMYLAKTLTLRSLPEIGRRFGGRDHTTVLHAVRKIEALVSKDVALSDEVELLKRQLQD